MQLAHSNKDGESKNSLSSWFAGDYGVFAPDTDFCLPSKPILVQNQQIEQTHPIYH